MLLRINAWSMDETVNAGTLARLKAMDDRERRKAVAEIRTHLEKHVGGAWRRPQLTALQLQRWLDAGYTVGNHTRIIRYQIGVGRRSRHWAKAAEDVLTALGYQIGLLFDHRIASLDIGLRLSRIRSTADGNLPRFQAVASGLHPFVHRMRGRR